MRPNRSAMDSTSCSTCEEKTAYRKPNGIRPECRQHPCARRIETGQRLIEYQQSWLDRQRMRQRHACWVMPLKKREQVCSRRPRGRSVQIRFNHAMLSLIPTWTPCRRCPSSGFRAGSGNHRPMDSPEHNRGRLWQLAARHRVKNNCLTGVRNTGEDLMVVLLAPARPMNPKAPPSLMAREIPSTALTGAERQERG